MLTVFKIFNFSTYKFSVNYRKKNPGFEHHGYNKNPCNGTIMEIYKALDKYQDIEKIYRISIII